MADSITTGAGEAINRQTAHVRDNLRTQSEAFWDFQGQILQQMEGMSRAWFERRQEDTKAAQQAVSAMCSTTSPPEAIRQYMSWANESTSRMVRHALDVQGEMAKASQLMAGATQQLMGRSSEAVAASIQDTAREVRPEQRKTAE